MALKIVGASGPTREPRRLPIQETLRDTLADLLMRTCSVSKADPTDVALMGIYADKDGVTTAGVAGDWSFAAFAAASLAMVPPATAQEQAAAGALDELLRDCFYEVTNVLSRLFNGESVSHLRLVGLVEASDPRVAELQAGSNRHFDVLVDGYGTGRIGLYAIG